MIRDGDMFGRNITILEGSDKVGGSLDGGGSPEDGYVLRGGRMLESKCLCTFGLFASIPSLNELNTVTHETLEWNEVMGVSSKSRLFRDGQRQTAPKLCLMPLITSQFLPREAGDRPAVLPKGMHNLAFMGQFCEMPDDVAFTVEHSIRTAQLAVHGLLDLRLKPPGVYKGKLDPRVLLKAFRALRDMAA